MPPAPGKGWLSRAVTGKQTTHLLYVSDWSNGVVNVYNGDDLYGAGERRDDSDPSGKFAWILDPDGTKIELWQSTKR